MEFKERDLVFLQKKGAKKPATFREVLDNLAVIKSITKTKYNTLVESNRLFRNYEDFRSAKYLRSIHDPLIQEIFKNNAYRQKFLYANTKVMLKDSNKIFVINEVRINSHQMHYANYIELFANTNTFVLKDIYLPYYADELLPLPNPNDILKGFLNGK